MRGTKAKKIRKVVYGDKAKRGTRYARDQKTGEIFCVGLRSQYLTAKKER